MKLAKKRRINKDELRLNMLSELSKKNFSVVPLMFFLKQYEERELKPEHMVEIICKAVCEEFEVELEELKTPSRLRKHALPRQIIMKKFVDIGMTTLDAARFFNRDHATVIHACKTIADQCDTDQMLNLRVKRAEGNITKFLAENGFIKQAEELNKN